MTDVSYLTECGVFRWIIRREYVSLVVCLSSLSQLHHAI
jgi:hypothetical protein